MNEKTKNFFLERSPKLPETEPRMHHYYSDDHEEEPGEEWEDDRWKAKAALLMERHFRVTEW